MTGGTVRVVDVEQTPEELDYVIPDLAVRGAVTMLAGEAGAGKSRYCLGEAIRIARAGNRALVVDAENGQDVITRRVAAFGGADLPGLTCVEAWGTNLLEEDDYARFRKLVADHRPDLLVLDSWVSLWSGSESSIKQVKPFLECLRAVAAEYDCAVILIHHTLKSGQSYRGSSAIAATIEAVFTLTREGTSQDVRRIHCVKMRLDEEPDDLLIRLVEGGSAPLNERREATASENDIRNGLILIAVLFIGFAFLLGLILS